MELNSRKKEYDELGVYKAIDHLSDTEKKVVMSQLKNARLEYNTLAKKLSETRKIINVIKNSNVSAATKKQKLREKQDRMNNAAKAYVDKYKDFKRTWKID